MPTCSQPLKLNVGCGGQRPDGWLNADSSLSSLVQSHPLLYRLLPLRFSTEYSKPARYLDIRRRWPYPVGVFEIVYASHVFEHLNRTDANHFLAEAYRVLMPGGVLRIVVPDLLALARRYVHAMEKQPASEHAEEFLRCVNMHLDETYPPSIDFIRRAVAAFQGYPHQHKYMYDAASLAAIVCARGFRNPRFWSYGCSDRIRDIAAVECSAEGVPSVYLEVDKPTHESASGA